MGHAYQQYLLQYPIHRHRLVVPMQTKEIQDDDVIETVGTMIAVEGVVEAAKAVEIVGAERAADMSIGAGTKVHLVSPVSSPT
jgi:hypothetical protein